MKVNLLSILKFLALNVTALIISILPIYNSLKSRNFRIFSNINDTVFLINLNIDFIYISLNNIFSMRILINYFEYLSIFSLYLMLCVIFKLKIYMMMFHLKLLDNN